MNNKNYRRLTAFVQQYIAHNQTELVDHILKEDTQMKYYNNLHNHYYFRQQLSEGLFTGGMDSLCRRRDEITAKIQVLKEGGTKGNPMDPVSPSNKIALLERDLKLLENTQSLPKNALEWWLVPYWLAEKLKERDEVVLQILGCNWWGRSSVKKPLNQETVLFQICRERY
jgi:hypothetical protein